MKKSGHLAVSAAVAAIAELLSKRFALYFLHVYDRQKSAISIAQTLL
jgi:hypothetical protein